jgi:hypothetical protein
VGLAAVLVGLCWALPQYWFIVSLAWAAGVVVLVTQVDPVERVIQLHTTGILVGSALGLILALAYGQRVQNKQRKPLQRR